MKKIVLVGLLVAALVGVFAIPVLAHGPQAEGEQSTNQEGWQAMYEACATGDWEAMIDEMEEFHGAYPDYMPHDGYGNDLPDQDTGVPAPGWWQTGGHMGGWGGMMGWR